MKKTSLIFSFLVYIFNLSLPKGSFSQNIGIGTTTPAYKLDVKNGSINTDSLYRISSFPVLGIPGNANLFVGRQAGLVNTGIFNTFAGYSAGIANSNGNFNSFFGSQAGITNTTGGHNSFFGMNAGYSNSTGVDNNFFGSSAGAGTTSGSGNCFFGHSAGVINTTGYSNVAIGKEAFYNNMVGHNNIAIGDSALYHQDGVNGGTTYEPTNIAIGSKAGYWNKAGISNSFLGYQAGYNNSTGSSNSFIGHQAGYSNIASFNCFVGSQAGYSNTVGNANVFIGTDCAYTNTLGWGSTMVGFQAGYNNTTGQGNCYFGYRAGYINADAKDNSFFGVSAGSSNSGDLNSFIGHDAGLLNTTGYENTFLGQSAGNNNTTGFKNVLLGANTGTQSNNLSIATAVGYHAIVGCSNCMALGGTAANGEQTRVGINNPIPTTDLHIIQQTDAGGDKVRGIRLQRSVNTNHWRTMIDPSNNYIFEYNDILYSYVEPVGGAFVNPSDERLKKNIASLPGILDKLLLLQPKTYQYIATSDAGRFSYGFLAQDVEKLFPEFVFSSENGIKGIAYSNFSVIAIKAIQEQQEKINQLEKKNVEQEEQFQKLQTKNQQQEEQFQKQIKILLERVGTLEKKSH